MGYYEPQRWNATDCNSTQPQEPSMGKFWECYVEETDGGNHYRHWTLESAKKEAERLARLTNKTVYVFECVGKCKVEFNPVKWEYPRE